MWSGTVLNNGRRAFLSGQEPFAKAARQAGLDLGPSDTQQEILKEAWHMFIAGWQKLSLVDYPDKVACTLFTGGCNLRCPYCHNSELLDAQIPALHIPDILEYLRKRQGILDGVVVSGGEPCMQPDLADFLGELKQLGYLTKLDTNGCYPAVLQELLEAGRLRGHGHQEFSPGLCCSQWGGAGALGPDFAEPAAALFS